MDPVYAVSAELRPVSAFSMRVPYTYQSSITYPLPPPSTLIGMAANAVQRREDIPPLQALEQCEIELQAVAAVPKSAVVTTTVMVRVLKIEGKSDVGTDALPRGFGWCSRLQAWFICRSRLFAERLQAALRSAPITLGDGESLVVVESTEYATLGRRIVEKGEEVVTEAYLCKDLLERIDEGGTIYWVHERCMDTRILTPYCFPMVSRSGTRGQLWPSKIVGTSSMKLQSIDADGSSIYFRV